MKALGCLFASVIGCCPFSLICLSVFLDFGCAPQPRVACSGPAPITCECVTSCSADVDAGVIITDPPVGELLLEGCYPRCWDRRRGGP